MPASLSLPAMSSDHVQSAYRSLEQALRSARTDSDWESLFLKWNDLKAQISGEHARRVFREAQDTRDEIAEEAHRLMREEIEPIAEAHDDALRTAFLESPSRSFLEERFGKHLFALFELARTTFTEANIPLNVEVGELTSRYERILGGAAIEVEGETYTLPRAWALLTHPEESRRHAAWDGVTSWILEQSSDIQEIYSQMVRHRQQMAHHLDERNFVSLGYRRLSRRDYGPQEVEIFRNSIKQHVVPLVAEYRKKQAQDLGQETVKPWNMYYFPGLSLPPGIVPIAEQLARAQKLFDELHPTLGNHFRRMVSDGLIDLENRPGKRPGAFCTSFEDEGKVVIFCNSTGDDEDVSTLTHEMGHAFQGWESRWIVPLELRWPTYEACEVHSMGMEYLSLRHLGAFFKPEDVAKYRKLKLLHTITFLPYMALVDHFQHWVYEHPDHTPVERDQAWSDLWDDYMVGIDFSGCEHLKAIRWKRQAHIFADPFYYIDYAIAESGALQLWQRSETDPEAAMKTYLQLCHLGGSQSLLDIFRSVGLVSPFDPEVFAPALANIRKELALLS